VLGYLFAPIFSLLGAPTWAEAMRAGGMFGTKIVLNEFVSFIDLGQAKELSAKTVASSPLRFAASPISRPSRSRWP
jgi:CNT family concentrative nucleoside transporter